MNNLRILLADSYEIIRQGIRALLERRPGWEVVGEADNVERTLQLVEELRPDVLVVDFVNLHCDNGAGVLPEIRAIVPSIEIVVFTMAEFGAEAAALLSRGARGMVLKSDTTVDLVQAVEAAGQGKMFLSSAVAQLLVSERASNRPLSNLSDREMEILRLLAEGKSSKEVAAVLNLSSKTVDAHRSKIMSKLALNSLSDLIHFALRHNITKI